MNDDRKNTIKDYAIGILIPLAVGGLSALYTRCQQWKVSGN